MDEHRWEMPARNSAEPAVNWRADRTGIWMDAELIGFPEASREVLRLAGETALLRRERALLIELEKARTRILASIFETGGGCSAEDVRQVGELLMAVEAIHLEASGGVQRPDGVPCACVLCRPGGVMTLADVDRLASGEAPEVVLGPPDLTIGTCTACGEEREVFEGRCHDCISAGRRGKEG